MQLCFGCLHTFPENSLQKVSFSDDLAAVFDSLRSLVSKLQPTSAGNRHCVAQIEEDLRLLLRRVMEEMEVKDERIDTLTQQVKYLSDQEEYLRKANIALQNAIPKQPKVPAKQAKSKATPPYASGLLHRFLIASNLASPRPPGPPLDFSNSETLAQTLNPSPAKLSAEFTPAKTPRVANRFGETVSTPTAMLDMTPGGRNVIVRAPNPADTVGASLYNILEAMTIRVRGGTGILWLVGIDKDEILAPFVYGSKAASRRGCTPFHVNIASSTVGVVASTGISINVTNKSGYQDTNLQQLFTGTNQHSLYVPVFKEFGRAKQQCFGVVQIVAAVGALPFDTTDESVCANGCVLMSHVISSFQTMIPDWTAKTFDPTALIKASHYSVEEAEKSASQKGKSLVDSFTLPQALVYRCELVDPTAKIAKSDLQHVHPSTVDMIDALKEMHRYSATLESSWRGAVTAQSQLEKKVAEMSRQLDLARQGLNDARRSLNNQSALRYAAQSTSMKPETEGLGASTLSDSSPLRTRALSNAEFEELEAETLARAKSVKTLNPSSFFVTEETAGPSSTRSPALGNVPSLPTVTPPSTTKAGLQGRPGTGPQSARTPTTTTPSRR